MSPTRQPHDAIFKVAFESPQNASALLRSILPADVRATIDWSSFELESGSFIDPELQSSHADLLFSVKLGGEPALIYILLEHQSTVDPQMPLRVAEYLLRIWKRCAKQRGLPVPLIIPVTLSHAPHGWTGPVTIHELVKPAPASVPALATAIPAMSLLIFDLTTVDDAHLRSWTIESFPKLALLLLRDARDPVRLRNAFVQFRDLFLEVLHAENGVDAVTQVLRYIAVVAGEVRFEEFRATMQNQLPEAENIAMTIAEELHQKGLQQGLQKGLQKGLQQGRQEGLRQGRAESLTKQATLKFGELSPAHAAQLQTADIELLDRYVERVLWATTPDELFAG